MRNKLILLLSVLTLATCSRAKIVPIPAEPPPAPVPIAGCLLVPPPRVSAAEMSVKGEQACPTALCLSALGAIQATALRTYADQAWLACGASTAAGASGATTAPGRDAGPIAP